MNGDTRRKIDNARDVLVGKVPDPKSQVEQITIALTYRFMDYMDRQSEEMGGNPRFFIGEYESFAWSKLMDASLGGHDRINLYAEAIDKMSTNPNIDQLFRDVFKGAFLPYRNPETLWLFLKEIDTFPLDHTEDLGDAYEYLLSIMSSQGEAGQFRTPRHIIDFIVKAVDPKKDENILDPACGTAGFLICAYLHILEQNKKDKPGDLLTSDEKAALIKQFHGYDISPDMVRLALVNMYLHGFAQPSIHEYDTLSSEARWDDKFDVIMANPPFMTPKGGIRPHKRFAVQANRSELLFVDYIAEHLNPAGRAGIIVPEGIIFQSSNAYKALRKMLVEDRYLWAVVSLPGGVFNPYAGVKTSILLMDRELAKRSDDILFVSIANDGFGLGAQRRPIEANDLPAALGILREYQQSLKSGHSERSEESAVSPLAHIVPKSKVAASGDYNLSGDRYRETLTLKHQKWPMVELGELCSIRTGKKDVNSGKIDGRYPFFTCAREHTFSDAWSFDCEAILVAGNGDVGAVQYYQGKFEAYQRTYVLSDWVNVSGRYLYFCLGGRLKETLSNQKQGNTMPYVKLDMLSKFQVAIPPLEIQQQIVAEIEGYQKVIDGAKQVVDSWRPTIPIGPDWPVVRLGDVCSLGGRITTDVDLTRPYFGADSIESNTGTLLKTETAGSQRVSGPVYEFAGERLLYSKIRPYLNKLTVVDLRGYCSSDMYPLLPDGSRVYITYLATYMLSDTFSESIRDCYQRASIPKINRSQLFETPIAIPPLATQQQIVAEIEEERKAIEANKKLIEAMERRIKAKIAEVWGE